MLVFPNAKINLGLQITEKLPNGYHAINTCFYPVPITDALEFIEAKKTTFSSSGIDIPVSEKQNLVLKAYQLLKKDYQLPNISIHLLKQIPIGAGLGGGSADAAFMLTALNEYFQLFLDASILEDYAAQLGSDCPFFIENKPALATGTGTELTPFEFSLRGHWLVLVNPGIHISTQAAYAGVSPKASATNLEELLQSMDFDRWKSELINDFEASIFPQTPKLAEIKTQLYTLGANYAAMSGSGSTMFGIFKHEPQLKADFFDNLYVKKVLL
ncbi:4-(cytidine 5'-diphospho)-2-C-methyl-D-erythritol kinase [Roseivirga pacifica]|uniref:4-(cytidine 5'-diphospho)-2-C-methyl-D-erythritol kinase n=1 Tax=Roseivirga pacifica TaxID=1267423 RepID=UPI003BAE98BB